MNTRWFAPSAGTSASKKGYAWALIFCAIITVAAMPLIGHLDLANIVMLFLLGVLLIGVKFGRGPACWQLFPVLRCSIFFFVPPQLSFTVNDAQYW